MFKLNLRFILVLAFQAIATAALAVSPALSASAAAPAPDRTIKGVVVDTGGEPVIGAYVVVEGRSAQGAITDLNGTFSLTVPDSGHLQVTFIGYETLIVPITGQQEYRLVLRESSETLEDVVVVGYGTQRKESVVGAISQVKGSVLVESGVSNITNALAGKLSGVTTLQVSGQPGQNDAEIVIRGVSSFNNNSPLVLVDGVERDFASLDPNEVANISVLKDASATAVFGAKGANGVIIVTTRRGSEGKPHMEITFSQGLANPINTPVHVNAYDTMSLMNVGKMNDQQFSALTSGADLEQFRKPSSRINELRYPDVNWLGSMVRTFAPTTNANFNISGGTKFVKYFASVGFTHEGSIFQSFQDDKVQSSHDYNRFNFRTNVDFQVTRSTKVSINLGGNVGIKKKPDTRGGDSQFWLALYGSSTTKYPMYYPAWALQEVPDTDYPGVVEDRLVSVADQSTYNPYFEMMKGNFSEYTNTKVFSDLILNQRLDFITKGLYIQGKVSLSTYYNYKTLATTYTRPSYELYFDRIGTGTNPWYRSGDDGYVYTPAPLYTTAANSLESGYYLDLYYDISLNYDRTFGKHHVTALALLNRQEQDKGTDFPYYNEAIVGRVTYDYAHKYLLEYNMGYTGSERFAPSNRFGFFPSGAIGWVVSEEDFFKPIKPVLSKLKFRYSIGLVGSDHANNRWLYISEYSKDSTGHIVEDKAANLVAQWEEALKQDLGIEMGFLKNALTLNVDLFKEYRSKMLIGVDNNTPIWLGTTSKELNNGAIKKHGFEVELNYFKQINRDWNITAGGNFSFNENRIVYADDAPFALDHKRKIGAPIGTPTDGVYLIDGEHLVSVDDIHSNFLPTSVNMGSVVVGDYKYLDFTGDGIINSDDTGRILGSLYPPIAYAFNAGFGWKGFNLNVLFQGYAHKYSDFNSVYEYEFYKGNFKTHLSSLDYWSPANPSGNHAATHFQTSNHPNSAWAGYHESSTSGYAKMYGHTWRRSDFLRLKEASLSYTWKGQKLRKAGIQGLRVYANGSNLLTFTDLLEGDPESKYLVWGEYPHVRNIKFGVQVNF